MPGDTEHYQMQGDAPALLYERYLVPVIASRWADDLVERGAPKSGERVLDVACGTGIVARTAARGIQMGRVAALDINPGMLSVARSLPMESAVQIEWYEGSVLDMPFPEASFDLVLCQLGLQFFPDCLQALREIFRVLVPTGRLVLSVFREIERTPMAHAFAEALDKHLKPGASKLKRVEHGLSDAGELRQLATDAGFQEANVVPAIQIIRYSETREYVRVQLIATPQAGLLSGMGGEQREAIFRRNSYRHECVSRQRGRRFCLAPGSSYSAGAEIVRPDPRRGLPCRSVIECGGCLSADVLTFHAGRCAVRLRHRIWLQSLVPRRQLASDRPRAHPHGGAPPQTARLVTRCVVPG